MITNEVAFVAIAVSDKEEQEIKHLGLERQQYGSAP